MSQTLGLILGWNQEPSERPPWPATTVQFHSTTLALVFSNCTEFRGSVFLVFVWEESLSVSRSVSVSAVVVLYGLVARKALRRGNKVLKSPLVAEGIFFVAEEDKHVQRDF